MKGGEGDCRARAAACMAGGPATGEDATDYDVGIPDELRKCVLFDEKEHCRVKAHVADRKNRVVKYSNGRYKP